MGVDNYANSILFISCHNFLQISGHIQVILPAAKVGRFYFHRSRVILQKIFHIKALWEKKPHISSVLIITITITMTITIKITITTIIINSNDNRKNDDHDMSFDLLSKFTADWPWRSAMLFTGLHWFHPLSIHIIPFVKLLEEQTVSFQHNCIFSCFTIFSNWKITALQFWVTVPSAIRGESNDIPL